MKKSFAVSLFACMMAMPMMAFGKVYDSPNHTCYAKKGDVIGNTTVKYNYIVFFENDRPYSNEKNSNLETVTGQSGCVAELKQKLNEIPLNDDTRIVLIASADKTAGHTHNDGLSQRRANIVKALFDAEHSDDSRLILHIAGETNDNFTGTGNSKNPWERAVRIIVANSAAEAQTIINSYAKITTDVKVHIYEGNAKASAQRIENIVASLNGEMANLERSVWKDKNGNFNTSRLLSDSIAGVVLGTAGGLITSHVIKKNQLKGGFEDIKCTVGGQVVAEYGDDFMVGIR